MPSSPTISAVNGSKFYIGTASDINNQTLAVAAVYTQVKQVSTMPDYGDTATPVPFLAVDSGREIMLKGTQNGGTSNVTCGYVAGDAGQAAMDAAELSHSNYFFKIVMNDQPVGGTAPTTVYLWGMVTSKRKKGGAANSVEMVDYTIAINDAPIEIQAS